MDKILAKAKLDLLSNFPELNDLENLDELLVKLYQLNWLSQYMIDDDGEYVEFFEVIHGYKNRNRIFNAEEFANWLEGEQKK